MKNSIYLGKINILIVFLVLIFGCNDKNQEQPIPKKEVVNEPKAERIAAPEVKSKELIELQLTKIEPLQGKELTPFLPVGFGSSLSSSTSKVNKDGYNWTKTLGEFLLSDGTSITVGITDYGGSAVLAARTYEIPTTEVGVTVEKLNLPNGFGYKVYNSTTKNGLIAVLVGKRFGIEIEGRNISDKFGDIGRVLEKIDIDGLLKKAK